MRFMVALGLGGALVLVGCGSDGGSGSGRSGGGGSGPAITAVAWDATVDCTRNERSDVIVTVTATAADPDTLIYSGSVSGCDGAIDAAVSMISCPNVSPYPGTVTVSDPDGNMSTPVAFDVPVCDSGGCTTDPDTCG